MINYILFAILSINSYTAISSSLIDDLQSLKSSAPKGELFQQLTPEINHFLLRLYNEVKDNDSFYNIIKQLSIEEIDTLKTRLTFFENESLDRHRKTIWLKIAKIIIHDFYNEIWLEKLSNIKAEKDVLNNLHEISKILYFNPSKPIENEIISGFLLQKNLSYAELTAMPEFIVFMKSIYNVLAPFQTSLPSEDRKFVGRLQYLVGERKPSSVALSPVKNKNLEKRIPNPILPHINIIFNNDAYEANCPGYPYKKGNSIVCKDSPIGYVIRIPPKTKRVLVYIYGGFNSALLSNNLFRPNDVLDNFFKQLLCNSITVIHLNLPDLLKNRADQRDIGEYLIEELHRCINYFYQILKEDPTSIHPELRVLENTSYFLMGASFGGGRAVHHAQHYPHTFDGYISHAGSLYGDEGVNKVGLAPHLKVAKADLVKKIEDPIFFHHVLEDNLVNCGTSLYLYYLAIKNGKDHLMRLCISDHGNKDLSSEHGHYFPEGYYLRNLVEQLVDFIASKGHGTERNLHNYRWEKYSLLIETLADEGNHVHSAQPRNLNKVLAEKSVEYFHQFKRKNNVNIYNEKFDDFYEEKILPVLLFHVYRERIRNTFNNRHTRREHGELVRKEIAKFIGHGGLVNKVIEHIAADESMPSLEMIASDFNEWLETKDLTIEQVLKTDNLSMLEFFISQCLLSLISSDGPDTELFDALKHNNILTYEELKSDIELKETIKNILASNKKSAARIIFDKCNKNPLEVKRLIDEYRNKNLINPRASYK